jgi:hypothetical protein
MNFLRRGDHAGGDRAAMTPFRHPAPVAGSAPTASARTRQDAPPWTDPRWTPAPGRHADRIDVPQKLAEIREQARRETAGTTAARATRQSPSPWPAVSLTGPPPVPEVAPPVLPVVLPPAIFDALGGDSRTARTCGHCGALDRREDFCWRSDAHLIWSCPGCQMEPGWRSPRQVVLYGLAAEYRLVCAASVVARDTTPGRRLYAGAPWRSPVRVTA